MQISSSSSLGMYIRVPKQVEPPPPTKAEKVAMKKSRMDQEKEKVIQLDVNNDNIENWS